jgi:predicted SAM-dependent methyltransferase
LISGIKKIIRIAINQLGYDLIPRESPVSSPAIDLPDWFRLCDENSRKLRDLGIDKAHYGCGPQLFGAGWVNLDLAPAPPDHGKVYLSANLVSQHPFPSNFFRYAFAEDFLEHLDQSESLIFLAEAFRTLQPGGVLRLSFPGLRGVLTKHYRSSDFAGASLGQQEAYTMWDHKHFYCEESLAMVARHIGFAEVQYLEYGRSSYAELCHLDYRQDQKDLNIFAELTK